MDNPQLTIADLVLLQGLMDSACSRGAFKANEMKQVGEVYEKLTDFLQAVKSQAELEAAQQTQGE